MCRRPRSFDAEVALPGCNVSSGIDKWTNKNAIACSSNCSLATRANFTATSMPSSGTGRTATTSISPFVWCSGASSDRSSRAPASLRGRRTARNKISEFLRTRRSAVHVGEKRIDALSDTAAESFEEDAETYLTALRSCREKLPPADDELLQLRYGDNLSTVEIAKRLQRLRPSVSRSLNRIRQWLFDCVESELAALDDSPEGLP